MKTFIIFNVIVLSMLFSCSSPESDGEKQAKNECDAWDTYAADVTKAYNDFIREFENKNYKTRIEARNELNKSIEEAESQLNTKLNELSIKRSELIEKYQENPNELQLASNTYNSVINTYSVDTSKVEGLRNLANSKILTIIPPDPTMEKIKEDFVGRTIRALPGGYLSDDWAWTIAAGEIKDLQILEVNKVDTYHKEILVSMTLQEDGIVYKTRGKVYYILDDRDDWEIDVLEPYEIEVVKTGRYDSCITAEQDYSNVYIYNKSDATLFVGFRTYNSDGTTSKHSLVVPGGKTRYHYAPYGFSIDFVERP